MDLGSRFVRGAAWMLAAKLSERTIGLVSTLILVRLLIPEDFGLVAMAAPVIGLVELLGNFGFAYSLIQIRNLNTSHLDTAWTLSILVSTLLAALLWSVASPAAIYYREPRLEGIVEWLSLGLLVQGFQSTGMVALQRELRMGPEVIVLLVKKISSLIVAVIAAVLLKNYWALVWAILVSRFAGVFMSYVVSSYRPRFSLAARRQIIGFSAWMFISNLLQFMYQRVNDLIVGRQLGAGPLAFLTVSMDLAGTVTNEALAAISRASYPTYAEVSGNLSQLRSALRQILAGIASFAFPAGLGIAAVDGPLVLVLLGEAWRPAIPVIGPLAIALSIIGVTTQAHYVYMSLGKPKTATAITALNVAILTTCSVIAVPLLGIQGAVIAYTGVAVATATAHYFLLRRYLPGFGFKDCVLAFWRPLIASGVMFATLRVMRQFLDAPEGSLIWLLVLIAVGILVYSVILLVLWRLGGSPSGPERTLLEALSRIYRRLAVNFK